MIRKATMADAERVGALMAMLWPHHSPVEMEREAAEVLGKQDCAIFLMEDGSGFAQCGLRRDYVEGTESSPVGYLEGIFVKPDSRRQGIAWALLHECENWAKEKGCREFASDCELENTQSLEFHLKMGFAEANRIICFTKRL